MTKVKVNIEIVPKQCPVCGIHYGIDQFYLQQLMNNKETFYCPRGDSLWFKETEDEKKLRELEAQLQEAKTELRYTTNELEYTKRSRSAYKAQLTKTKNRIHKGICPVCNRQFTNLHRHMEGQHPNYLEEQEPAP